MWITRNTTCFFTTDHGDYLGRRGRLYKSPLIPFDEIAKVPFFAWGAGVPKGTHCRTPISFADFAPTFLDLAGEDIPADLDGESLLHYFDNPNHQASRPVYCWGRDGFDMVRNGDWKYFRSHDKKEEMLFNLKKDPDEWTNVAADPAYDSLRKKLARQLDRVFSKATPNLPKFSS